MRLTTVIFIFTNILPNTPIPCNHFGETCRINLFPAHVLDRGVNCALMCTLITGFPNPLDCFPPLDVALRSSLCLSSVSFPVGCIHGTALWFYCIEVTASWANSTSGTPTPSLWKDQPPIPDPDAAVMMWSIFIAMHPILHVIGLPLSGGPCTSVTCWMTSIQPVMTNFETNALFEL